MASKSCIESRGPVIKDFKSLKTVTFFAPIAVSIIIISSGTSHSSFGSFRINENVGQLFCNSGISFIGKESISKSGLPNMKTVVSGCDTSVLYHDIALEQSF